MAKFVEILVIFASILNLSVSFEIIDQKHDLLNKPQTSTLTLR